MTELVVDDTPSPPVTGSSECECVFVCVRLLQGNTGQDSMWSEAGGQLVEWDASVAGGYKVSFQRHTQDHPVSSHNWRCALCRATQQEWKQHIQKKCHVHKAENNTNTHSSLGRERVTTPVYRATTQLALAAGELTVSCC